jgi:hypothetical protein
MPGGEGGARAVRTCARVEAKDPAKFGTLGVNLKYLSLNPVPYTLHPIPCTLHPIP